MDPLVRLASAVAILVPAARLLPTREMGVEIQIPMELGEHQDALLDRLRQRLAREDVAVVGAKLVCQWPPRSWRLTWVVAVHRDRVGLLADALEKNVVYPLLLGVVASEELQRLAPTIAGLPRLHAGDISMLFATDVDLDSIEAEIAKAQALVAPDSPGGRPTPSAALDAIVAAVVAARRCPVEVLA